MAIRAPRSNHELYECLQDVLSEAHATHVYVSDIKQYGVQEHWQPGTIGDCEDFALHCRFMLKFVYGLDSDLIFCQTEKGEGHLVCSHAGWILDNRHPWVMRRDALPYKWIALGGPAPDFVWRRILSVAPNPYGRASAPQATTPPEDEE